MRSDQPLPLPQKDAPISWGYGPRETGQEELNQKSLGCQLEGMLETSGVTRSGNGGGDSWEKTGTRAFILLAPTAGMEPKLVPDREGQRAPEKAGLSCRRTHLPSCQGLCTFQPWSSSPQGLSSSTRPHARRRSCTAACCLQQAQTFSGLGCLVVGAAMARGCFWGGTEGVPKGRSVWPEGE